MPHRFTKVTIELYLIMVGIFTPLIQFIDKYVFNDWDFLVSLSVLIGIDTLLSLFIHWRDKSISSEGFARLFMKVIIYGIFLIVIHIATHLTANGDAVGILSWVDSVGYSVIVVREFISILEKCYKINPTILPMWILERLKHFDKTGKTE